MILAVQDDEETIEAEGALTIGIIGVGLCCAILGAVVILDLATIHRHFAFMKRNVDDFLYRRGWKKDKPMSKRVKRRTLRKTNSSSSSSRHIDMEQHVSSEAKHRYDPEPRDLNQVELRFDNEARACAQMPANSILAAQLDVNGLRGQGPIRGAERPHSSNTEHNFNTLDRKNLETRYQKALNGYANLELSQTKL